jgi:hypothetical protein
MDTENPRESAHGMLVLLQAMSPARRRRIHWSDLLCGVPGTLRDFALDYMPSLDHQFVGDLAGWGVTSRCLSASISLFSACI